MPSVRLALFSVLLCGIIISVVIARDADERQNYLFADDPEAQDLILEYQVSS